MLAFLGRKYNLIERSELVIRIISFFWLIGKVMSYKLWIEDRTYPTVPVFDFLGVFPDSVHLAIFGLSFLGMLYLVIFPASRIILGVIILEILSCLLDHTRWQPWEYMYVTIFLVYYLNKDRINFFYLLNLFFASFYIFTGLHKLQGGFIIIIWYDIILKGYLGFPTEAVNTVPILKSGYLIPLIEIFFGFGLVFFPRKRVFLYLAIITHLVILIVFGPFGLYRNIIILPWNVALVLILLITLPLHNRDMIIPRIIPKQAFWILMWFMLPFLSFYNLWSQFFSANLFSGKPVAMTIYLDKNNDKALQKYVVKNSRANNYGKSYELNIYDWAIEELNIVPIGEERYYRSLKDRIVLKYPELKSAVFIVKIYSEHREVKL